MKKSKLRQIIKEIIQKVLNESLSSKEEAALEDIFNFNIEQTYTAIDGNQIETEKFEDMFQYYIEINFPEESEEIISQGGYRDCSTGDCSFKPITFNTNSDDADYVNFLLSIKNKLITHLIDNIGIKTEVFMYDSLAYYYSPFVKNNTIYINFIPPNYSTEKDTKFDNPKGNKIKWHPLEINGYKFYAYLNYNPEVKLGKGKNVAEFQTVKIPGNETTKYLLATLPINSKTKKISEDTLQRRLILINYLKTNNIPFLIDTRDPSRSYIQVPITYIDLSQIYK